jgi:hypothetical protein
MAVKNKSSHKGCRIRDCILMKRLVFKHAFDFIHIKAVKNIIHTDFSHLIKTKAAYWISKKLYKMRIFNFPITNKTLHKNHPSI